MTQRVWLITGCSSGLGELLVRRVVDRGDRVIATGRRLQSIKHLETIGSNVATLQLDVTDDQQTIRDKIQEAIAIFGRIDVLVNNAGYIQTGSWEDLEYEQLLAQFDTNVFGVVKVTRAVLPHFRDKHAGTMVFIGSRSGWYGDPFCGAYAGSKFALEGMVESLRWETEAFGIKTLLIDPGRFRTNFLSPEKVHHAEGIVKEYTESFKKFQNGIAGEDRNQPGDPEKAISIIIDLVHGNGIAENKSVPFRLPLGTDCYDTMKEECEETLQLLKEWKDVITGTEIS